MTTGPEPGTRSDPAEGIAACVAAHGELGRITAGLDDAAVRRASRLPGWSIGHVLTHLARNAEAHIRWLEGALEGRVVERYPGGPERRARDIEQGSTRSAGALRDDVLATSAALEQTWARLAAAGWPDPPRELWSPTTLWPTRDSPWRRLIEVEVHLVDLGLGYEPTDWSEVFVAWMLPRRLRQLEKLRPDPGDRRALLAWLVGRSDEPGIGPIDF